VLVLVLVLVAISFSNYQCWRSKKPDHC